MKYCECCEREQFAAPDPCPHCGAVWCMNCLLSPVAYICCDERNFMTCNHCGLVDDVNLLKLHSGALVKLCVSCEEKARKAGTVQPSDPRSYRECERCHQMDDCEEVLFHGYTKWICEKCYHAAIESGEVV